MERQRQVRMNPCYLTRFFGPNNWFTLGRFEVTKTRAEKEGER